MKFDGAFKPQGAFPYDAEGSIGAQNRKYRDKFQSSNYTSFNKNFNTELNFDNIINKKSETDNSIQSDWDQNHIKGAISNAYQIELNENITKSSETKGFAESLIVDSRHNNNTNNINNCSPSYCFTSGQKVTKESTLSNLIKLLLGSISGKEENPEGEEQKQNAEQNSNKFAATANSRQRDQGISNCIKMKTRSTENGSNVFGRQQSATILCSKQIMYFFLLTFFVLSALPHSVKCDESDFFAFNSFSLGPDSSQADLDAGEGKFFGDKCEASPECKNEGMMCDEKKKTCRCTDEMPITNHYDKCGRIASVNESCRFNEQCEAFSFQTECRDGRCICKFDLQPVFNNGNFECAAKQPKARDGPGIDPAMIGILVVMALMFIIICVVLQLFSQARWHENRTIFNTPNPRLMNVSLLRESKQERRGSRVSVRGPSRQPSMASLRPHSPNPSLASRNSNSNGSVASIRSRCDSTATGSVKGHHPPHHHPHHHHGNRKNSQPSNQQTPLITNVTPNPAAESVTVEIIEPNTNTTNNHTDI